MITSKKTPYLFLLPYLLLFTVFIVIPTGMAVMLSFTNYNAVQTPEFVGLTNYINLLTQDTIFLQYVLPNTLVFSIIVGVGGYLLSFVLAWSLSQVPKAPRTVLALILYSPSMTAGVAMSVVWRTVFLGSQSGIANYVLTALGVIDEPILWLSNATYIMPIVIIVALWSSMGVGFLAMLAGLLNVSPELYEAASVDGAGRFRKIWHVTLPGLRSTIITLLIMNLGRILGSEFDRPYALSNKLVTDVSNVLSIFVYQRGIKGMQFSLSTAVGLFQSVIGVFFLLGANKVANKFGERGVW